MAQSRKNTDEVKTDAEQKQAQEPRKEKTVQMKREDGKTADVHPDMVDHYRKGGYELVSE